ncbi:hypothetical protein ATANTOWER_011017, partial [Ataeniobius toweri]|nr:hypothetical protein [Ataeniobius toweri]
GNPKALHHLLPQYNLSALQCFHLHCSLQHCPPSTGNKSPHRPLPPDYHSLSLVLFFYTNQKPRIKTSFTFIIIFPK